MIKFRQKAYTGKTETIVGLLKKHPTLAVSTVGLGVSGANLGVNMSRHKEAKRYQKEQLKAMDKLTDVLGKVDKSLDTINTPKHKLEDDKPKRFKFFSIETGGFKRFKIKETSSREKNLREWLSKVTLESMFYNPEEIGVDFLTTLSESSIKKESETYMETGDSETKIQSVQVSSTPEGIAYEENSNPEEYPVSVFSKNNVLVLYVNNPNPGELQTLNNILDKYCEISKDSDYISERVSKNTFLVQVKLGHDYKVLAKKLLESGIRFNILTVD